MLIFGDYKSLLKVSTMKDFNIYNLSSLVEGYQPLRLIPQDIGSTSIMIDNNTFIEQYSAYIFNNDSIFIEFMKVIMDLYIGNNVFIINSLGTNILGGDIFERVAESLIKIIELRYGYKSYIVNEPSDLDLLDEYMLHSEDSTGFQIYGLQNLDIDKERLMYLKGGKK